jgi:cytochrome c peroxidase
VKPLSLAAATMAIACLLVPTSPKGHGMAADVGARVQDRRRGPFAPLPPQAALDADGLARVALGKALFQDARLSGDARRSCASCHDVRTNGASTVALDRAPDGALLDVNTPTVFNAGHSFRLNWAGDIQGFRAQARASIENPKVMNNTLPEVTRRLRRDPAMVARFRAAFGRPPAPDDILQALSDYQASLSTPDSRFDRWLGGQSAALSAQELRGYQLFQSTGCAACHQGVNLGGNLYQKAGVFHPLAQGGSPVLRVPSLRNIAETAPYFHDGSATTLDQAVRAMGKAQLNRVLTPSEVAQITAFLGSLTGRHEGRPVRAKRR